MGKVVDALAWLLALLLGSVGVQWLVVPERAAEGLGMTLLDGAGRASQIGDGASFFLTAALLIVYGLLRRNAVVLAVAGLMIGSVAVFRIVAFVAHGAAFTPVPIAVEVVTLVVTLLAARSRRVAGS